MRALLKNKWGRCYLLLFLVIGLFTYAIVDTTADRTFAVLKDIEMEVLFYNNKLELPELIQQQLATEDFLDKEITTVLIDPQLYASPSIPVEIKSLPEIIKYPTRRVSAEGLLYKATAGFSNKAISEVRCIAFNIFFEAGKEDYVGKIGVGNVTNKRKTSKFWKSSYCGVVKAGYKRKGQIGSCQFSWYCDGKLDRIYLYSQYRDKNVIKTELNKILYKAWVDSIKIAINTYNEKIQDVTGGATHYYNPRICYKNSVKVGKLCHPKWAVKGLKKGTLKIASSLYLRDGFIGNHFFLVELRAHKVMKAGL